MVSIIRLIAWTCFCGFVTVAADMVCCEPFPGKPIRIVVSVPGSSSDFAARLVAPGLTNRFGQPIIVENRANDLMSGQIVSGASPDGHTLLLAGSSFWVAPLLQKMPYDSRTQFTPVTLVSISPFILVTHPSLAVTSVKELIALAKTRPGELNIGTGGSGSGSHLASELFKFMAGVDIKRVPYKSVVPALTALIGGEVQLGFGSVVAASAHVKAGRLKGLAVASLQPTLLAPGLPTISANLRGYESGGMDGIFAPAGTPAATITSLNRELVALLNQSDIKQRLFNSGTDVVASSPMQFSVRIKSELDRMDKIIKAADIKME